MHCSKCSVAAGERVSTGGKPTAAEDTHWAFGDKTPCEASEDEGDCSICTDDVAISLDVEALSL